MTCYSSPRDLLSATPIRPAIKGKANNITLLETNCKREEKSIPPDTCIQLLFFFACYKHGNKKGRG